MFASDLMCLARKNLGNNELKSLEFSSILLEMYPFSAQAIDAKEIVSKLKEKSVRSMVYRV